MINIAENLSHINIDALPPQLRQLVKTIGLYDSYRLIEERGGIRIFIPENPDNANVLKGIISDDSTKKICAAFATKTIELPKLDKIKIQLRNTSIYVDSKLMNNPQLARKYDLTRKQIINILNTFRKEDPTPDMFESVLKTGS